MRFLRRRPGLLLTLVLVALCGLSARAHADAATFTYSPDPPGAGQVITFTATDPQATSYSWSFDDVPDSTQTGSVATHTFTTSGQHHATLTTSLGGPATPQYFTVTPDSPPVIGTITVPGTGTVGLPANFSATASDPDGDPLTYTWDFGDGTTGTGPSLSHRYTAPNSGYPVTLTVSDDRGGSVQASGLIDVGPDTPPTVVVGASANSARPGAPILFFANARDPDEAPGTLIYHWTFGDGTGATTQNPAHAYAAAGAYTVKLTVTDAAGATGFDSDSILVQAAPPAANAPPRAAIGQSPRSFKTGQTVKLTATASDPDGRVLALAWDLDGDGVYGNDSGVSRDGRTASVRFSRPGRHVVRLRATDDRGATTVATRTLTALNRPPVASFTFSPSRPRTGQRIKLFSLATDPDGPVAAQRWDLDGDGHFHNGTARSSSVAFKKAGRHRVGLQVTDADGAKSTVYRTLTVLRRSYPLLTPFPSVEITGSLHSRSTNVRQLNVRAPRGSRVRAACYGRACPVGRFAKTVGRSRAVRISSFMRTLPAGVRVVVTVTKTGRTGKYTSFLFRSRSRAPMRRDLCLAPDKRKPTRCP